jgi:hypothetical protein
MPAIHSTFVRMGTNNMPTLPGFHLGAFDAA